MKYEFRGWFYTKYNCTEYTHNNMNLCDMPDEIIAECLTHLDLMGLWLAKTTCMKFCSVIGGIILRGPMGAKMRAFNTNERYLAAIATGRVDIFDLVMKSAAGKYVDIVPESASYYAAGASLAMVRRMVKLGYPIISNVVLKCLTNTNHEEAVETFEWIEEHYGYAVPETTDTMVCAHAAESGNLDTLKYVEGRGYPISAEVWRHAFKHPVMMEWCIAEDVPRNVYTMEHAANQGDPQLLQRLFDAGFHIGQWDGYDLTISSAVESGSVETIAVVLKNTPAVLTRNSMDNAARLGHVHVLRYMIDTDVPYTESVAAVAANYGWIDILQLLVARGLLVPATTRQTFWNHCDHLAVVDWALSAGFAMSTGNILRALAGSGDAARFAAAIATHSAEITPAVVDEMYEIAEKKSRLDNMKIIHNLGHQLCPTLETYWHAHAVEVVYIEWLYSVLDSEGYDITSPNHINSLFITGNLTALKYLHNTGRIDALRLGADEIGCCVYVSILRWLVSLGKRFTTEEFAIAMGCVEELDAVIFIHEHAEINPDKLKFKEPCENGLVGVCQTAAAHFHLDALKWAYSRGYPMSDKVIEFALADNNTEMIKWARDKVSPHGVWDISIVDGDVVIRNTETGITY